MDRKNLVCMVDHLGQPCPNYPEKDQYGHEIIHNIPDVDMKDIAEAYVNKTSLSTRIEEILFQVLCHEISVRDGKKQIKQLLSEIVVEIIGKEIKFLKDNATATDKNTYFIKITKDSFDKFEKEMRLKAEKMLKGE